MKNATQKPLLLLLQIDKPIIVCEKSVNQLSIPPTIREFYKPGDFPKTYFTLFFTLFTYITVYDTIIRVF